jgi:hypothetical protein
VVPQPEGPIELEGEICLAGMPEASLEIDQDKFEAMAVDIAKSGKLNLDFHIQKQREMYGDNDEALILLLKAAKEGFGTGTALSQRMIRTLSTEEKEDYKSQPGHAGKAPWRMKWARVQYEDIVKTKTQVQSWDIEDTSIGEYLSLSSIVKHEGGRHCEQAQKVARRYVLACCKLGGRWVEWNPMTGRYDYLYMRKGRREVFRSSWSLMKQSESNPRAINKAMLGPTAAGKSPEAAGNASAEERTPDNVAAPLRDADDSTTVAAGTPCDPQALPSPSDPATLPQPAPIVATPKPKATGGAKAKAKAGAGPKAKAAVRAASGNLSTPKGKKPKTEFDMRVAEAEAAKNLYMLVTGKATLLLSNITNNKAWAWGRSHDIKGVLEKLAADVGEALSKAGDIGNSYISGCSISDMCSKYGEKSVSDAVCSLVRDLGPPCDALKAHVDKVAAMHTIMSQ